MAILHALNLNIEFLACVLTISAVTTVGIYKIG